jgi:hypothetical protein
MQTACDAGNQTGDGPSAAEDAAAAGPIMREELSWGAASSVRIYIYIPAAGTLAGTLLH